MGETWRAWIMAVIGAWFFVSGFVFGTQAGQFTIFGGLILLLGISVAVIAPQAQTWRSWLMVFFSGWLAVMPSFVTFTAGRVAASVTLIVGLLGVVLAVWMAATTEPRPPSPSSVR